MFKKYELCDFSDLRIMSQDFRLSKIWKTPKLLNRIEETRSVGFACMVIVAYIVCHCGRSGSAKFETKFHHGYSMYLTLIHCKNISTQSCGKNIGLHVKMRLSIAVGTAN